MAQSNEKRLASARQRLRRIEKIIDPYSEPDEPQKQPTRRKWVPGDFLINPEKTTSSAQVSKRKQSA